MQLIKRAACVICDSPNLTEHRTLHSFPIYMGTTMSPSSNDEFADQIWITCANCGCLQLALLIPLDVLYSVNHSREVVGSTWTRHHNSFKKFIMQSHPKKICEIGASHGYLASEILNEDPTIEYLIIEPAPTTTDARIRIVSGLIEDNLDKISKNSTIIHSHVLEHLYNPKQFLRQLSEVMVAGDESFISFPNLEALLIVGGANALNFEHTYFLTLDQLKQILEEIDLQIVEIEHFENHSVFLKVAKVSKKVDALSSQLKISSIQHLISHFDFMWDDLASFVERVSENMKVTRKDTYLFGAHVFSQAIESLGLDRSQIVGVLDNSLGKIGERLYGTPYFVFPPEIIASLTEVRVILKAAQYQNEIREQLLKINPLVEILE